MTEYVLLWRNCLTQFKKGDLVAGRPAAEWPRWWCGVTCAFFEAAKDIHEQGDVGTV